MQACAAWLWHAHLRIRVMRSHLKTSCAKSKLWYRVHSNRAQIKSVKFAGYGIPTRCSGHGAFQHATFSDQVHQEVGSLSRRATGYLQIRGSRNESKIVLWSEDLASGTRTLIYRRAASPSPENWDSFINCLNLWIPFMASKRRRHAVPVPQMPQDVEAGGGQSKAWRIMHAFHFRNA